MASREASPRPEGSFTDRAKALKEASPGTVGFMQGITLLFLASVGCTIFAAFTLIIPATMITIGALYLDFCPAEPYIPIYLVVAGSFAALRILNYIACTCFLEEDGTIERRRARLKVKIAEIVVDAFQGAWFIAGNVWVYRLHGDFSSDSTSENYCEPTLYWFAFWIITASYILCGSFCCCFGFCAIFTCCYAGIARRQANF